MQNTMATGFNLKEFLTSIEGDDFIEEVFTEVLFGLNGFVDPIKTLAELYRRGLQKNLSESEIKYQLLFLAMVQLMRGNNIKSILEESQKDFTNKFLTYVANFGIAPLQSGTTNEITLGRLAVCFAYPCCYTLHHGMRSSVVTIRLPSEYPRSMRTPNFAYLIPGREVNAELCNKLMVAHLAHQCLFNQAINPEPERRSSSTSLSNYQMCARRSKLYSNEMKLRYLKNLEIITQNGLDIKLNANILKFADGPAQDIIDEHDRTLKHKLR